jgi:hypothetical protein
MSLVTIKKAHLESELLVAKSKLESEGIRCYLRNEFTTQIINYMPSFEVELQVSEKDVSKALGIIEAIETEF